MFASGDKVYTKNFGQGQRWLPGVITEVTGPASFMVRLGDGRIIRRHQDHLRIRKNDIEIVSDPEVEGVTCKEAEVPSDNLLDTLIQPSTSSIETEPGGESSNNPDNTETESDTTGEPPTDHEVVVDTGTLSPPTSEGTTVMPQQTPLKKTYPKRNRHPPDWYDGKCTA